MSEEERIEKILTILQNHDGELFTKEVAKLAGFSTSTTAKYLSILLTQGEILLRKQKPFKYWRAKENLKRGRL